ncbi:hypothetical protein [Acidovorax delafieldii]|jgi:hypothetical protein|uniref:hypothetical protein n=1 Tax=Acidovorax delafieldii TaxID=47920 RepID=UPI000A8339D7|nr:hypothetical protein [Acidovorax delafieldii]
MLFPNIMNLISSDSARSVLRRISRIGCRVDPAWTRLQLDEMRDYLLLKVIVNKLNQCGPLSGALTTPRSKVRDGAWFVRQEVVRVNRWFLWL